MAYQKYGLVQAADYNTYVGVDPGTSATGFNTVYAKGSGRSGYGQNPPIPRVQAVDAPTGSVHASEWIALIGKMSNVASHQGTTIDTMEEPIANVSPITTISTTTAPILSLFDLNLPKLYNNRNNAVAQGSPQNYSGISTTPFSDNLVFTHTINFQSGDKARYFFNAGGQISLSFSHPTGTGMNQLWNSLTAACGKLTISTHNSGTITIAGNTFTGLTRTNGSGTSNILLTDSGYHSLSQTTKTVFKQFAATDGPTVSSLQSYIDVIISTNGTQGSNSDAGSILYITTRFVQAGTSQVSGAGSTVTCTVTPPSTTYLQNTWDPITVDPPTCVPTNSSVIEPPVIVPPPVLIPSTYKLKWSFAKPDFGTNNTLAATLDVAATKDMTLVIPYTSTIAGVPAGTMNISITKGQLTGGTTLNLAGATPGGQGGTVTTNSGTLSIANTPSNISLSLIEGNQAFNMSPDIHGTFTYTVDTKVTVPPGITKISFIVVGAGGGGGGGDVSKVGSGNNGLPGKKLVGDLTVVPGDTLNFYIGSGGTGGISKKGDNRKTHAYGGTNSNLGNGGEGGLLTTSGQGGGGGAATVLAKNTTVFAIAAGGGGGGGSGNGGKGVLRTKTEYTTGANGENALAVTIDAGTGGGGGGGELGGKAGVAPGGDTGASQGSQGKSKLPTGWVESNGTNGAVAKNVAKEDNGGTGYVTITY